MSASLHSYTQRYIPASALTQSEDLPLARIAQPWPPHGCAVGPNRTQSHHTGPGGGRGVAGAVCGTRGRASGRVRQPPHNLRIPLCVVRRARRCVHRSKQESGGRQRRRPQVRLLWCGRGCLWIPSRPQGREAAAVQEPANRRRDNRAPLSSSPLDVRPTSRRARVGLRAVGRAVRLCAHPSSGAQRTHRSRQR